MRVCFVSHHAYSLFDPRCRSPIGGAETQAWHLARGLSRLPEFDVHFVVQTPRVFRRRQIEDITVWNIGDVFDPLRRSVSSRVDLLDRRPWLRIREWHVSLLWALPVLAAVRVFWGRRPDPCLPHPLYEQIAADVICCFGVSGHAATAIASGRRNGSTTVLFLESNSDLDERFEEHSTYITRYGERGDVCHFVLESADGIVAQTSLQQELLKQRRGRESVRMTNAIDLTWWDHMSQAQQSDSLQQHGVTAPYVLWIGRADRFHKRPGFCLDVARQCPSIPFVMILNPGDPELEGEISAHAPPNVTIVAQVPFHEMPAVFSRAFVYLSTGSKEYEGAPNVFLQAAASGVPILSLDVSSGPLEESRGGFVADGDLSRLTESVQRLWSDPQARSVLGEQGRDYVERHCGLEHVVAELAAILRELAGAGLDQRTPLVRE